MVQKNFSRSRIETFLLVQAVAATAAVALRFWARRIKKAKLWWDDWLCIVTLVFFWCFVGIGVCAAEMRLLRDQMKLSYSQTKLLIRLMIPDVIVAVATITFARLSVIMLYYRVFSVSSKMRYGLWIIGIASVALMIEHFIIMIFQCHPIQSLLDPKIPGKCLNGEEHFLYTEIVNGLLDVVLVCMPIPLIWSLHLPLREKLAVGGVFLLGGFVAVTSVLMVANAYTPHQRTVRGADVQLWLSLQLCAAIACACFPTFRPFLVNIPRRIQYTIPMRNWYGTRSTSKKSEVPFSEHLRQSLRSPRKVKPEVIPAPDESDTRLCSNVSMSSEHFPNTHNTNTTEIQASTGDEDGIGHASNTVYVRNDVSVV